MNNNRIEYIDAMRGFTMILVVVGHVLGTYHTNDIVSYTNLFKCFRMPLFFFISGWVLYKKDVYWGYKHISIFLKKKFLIQIVPTIIFMSIILFGRNDITWKAFDYFKSGYWFTIALFEYFVIYSLFRFLSNYIVNNKYENHVIIFSGFLIYLIYYLLLVPDEDLSHKAIIINIIGIQQWCYYLFFCLGTIVKKYYNIYIKLSDKPYFTTTIILLFFGINIFLVNINFPLWNTIKFIILGTTGILIILTFFLRNENLLKKTNKIGYGLQYIGRRTLDVYLLHYFFLPGNLSILGTFIKTNGSPIVELVISLLLALIVISVCLILSNILRMSPILARFLFGVKTYD